MELTNAKLETLYNGLSHLSVDTRTNKQRRLPLLAGVRVRRTLKDIENSVKTLQEATGTVKRELQDGQKELLDQFKGEEITKEEFNEKSGELVDWANEELEPMYNKTVKVSFSDIVTMEDIEKIDGTLDGGVPSGVAETIFILEEIHENADE